MVFINGVIPIKEFVVASFVGDCLLGVILIASLAIAFGGLRVHKKGESDFSDFKRILGLIISGVGVVLYFYLLLSVRDESIIPLLDSFGLADHTGIYEVIVTDNVDMNEFQERYEVIGYENGVYIIKAIVSDS